MGFSAIIANGMTDTLLCKHTEHLIPLLYELGVMYAYSTLDSYSMETIYDMRVVTSRSQIGCQPLIGVLVIHKWWWVVNLGQSWPDTNRRLAKNHERTILTTLNLPGVDYFRSTPKRVWNLFKQLLRMRKKYQKLFGPWSLILIIAIILFLLTISWLWDYISRK
jgi:hypothetical protein